MLQQRIECGASALDMDAIFREWLDLHLAPDADAAEKAKEVRRGQHGRQRPSSNDAKTVRW
jgi:hypothetical protein